jgi:hypothetical protein
MISHPDIWSTAVMMVKRYDDNAILEAVERGKLLLDSGDMAGACLWYRIIGCIEYIQAQNETQTVH